MSNWFNLNQCLWFSFQDNGREDRADVKQDRGFPVLEIRFLLSLELFFHCLWVWVSKRDFTIKVNVNSLGDLRSQSDFILLCSQSDLTDFSLPLYYVNFCSVSYRAANQITANIQCGHLLIDSVLQSVNCGVTYWNRTGEILADMKLVKEHWPF
jgi:hypothetical protein